MIQRMFGPGQKVFAVGISILMVFGLAACGQDDSESDADTAYQHLYQLGYFPNPTIAARYPDWRPVVPNLPANPHVIDASFTLAIQKYQQNMGLPVSGNLTPDTLAAMRVRRCAKPDRDPALSPRNPKFANYSFPWPQTNITYRFASSGELLGMPNGASRSTIVTGMNQWANVTNLTFQQVTQGENVRIQWGDTGGFLGFQTWEGDTAVITLDNTSGVPWTTGELRAAATHEWGHALTLDHSALTNALMYPSASQTAFQDDDVLIANVLYNTWEPMPGNAWDIAVTPKTAGGDGVWMIDGTARQLFEWSGSAWTARGAQLPNNTYQLTVDRSNHPWVVDSANTIRVWNGFAWSTKPGSATSIAAGPSGKVYTSTPSGNVQVLNAQQNGWTSIGAPSGRQIWSVGTDRVGNVFALSQFEELWTYTTSSQTWALASAPNPVTWDVASGGGTTALSYTWSVDGNEQPAIWARQDAAAVGTGIPAADFWVEAPLPGITAYTIAVGLHGRAWVVDVNGGIWRRREVQ